MSILTHDPKTELDWNDYEARLFTIRGLEILAKKLEQQNCTFLGQSYGYHWNGTNFVCTDSTVLKSMSLYALLTQQAFNKNEAEEFLFNLGYMSDSEASVLQNLRIILQIIDQFQFEAGRLRGDW